MAIVDSISVAIHLLTGAVWAGTVTFVVVGVLPAAREGQLNAEPLGAIAGSLRSVSRVAAVLLVLTGGHLLAARGYLGERLYASGDGHLVLTMVGLWLVATGLVEVGTGRLVDGAGDRKVRGPARAATRFLQGAAVLAALVLVDAAFIVTT